MSVWSPRFRTYEQKRNYLLLSLAILVANEAAGLHNGMWLTDGIVAGIFQAISCAWIIRDRDQN